MDHIGADHDVVGGRRESLPGWISLQVQQLVADGLESRELFPGAVEEQGRDIGECVFVGHFAEPRQHERGCAARPCPDFENAQRTSARSLGDRADCIGNQAVVEARRQGGLIEPFGVVERAAGEEKSQRVDVTRAARLPRRGRSGG